MRCHWIGVCPGPGLFLASLKEEGVAAKLIAKELPATFVEDLTQDVKAISKALSDRTESLSSTAAIGRLIGEGMKEVNYLDAIMNNKYSRNSDRLRAWDSASRIERRPQRDKPVSETTSVAPEQAKTQAAGAKTT